MRIVLVAFLLLGSCAGPAPRAPGVLKIDAYQGAEPAIHLSAPQAKVSAVAVPQNAGRIVSYALGGENILTGGGYGLDLGPERTIPSHPAIWKGKHTWATLGDIATITSERDTAVGMRVGKNVMIDGATGALDILQRMTNVSGADSAWCFWDRTLCKSGGYCVIPLNPKSRFPAKWVIGTRRGPVWWEYDGVAPAHPNIKILDGMLVAKAGGKEQKVGADCSAGWIAYMRGRILFVKYFPWFPGGNYIDNGISVAHYFNDTIAELEPLSPEAMLKPEGEYTFPERWTLTLLDHEVTSHEEARAVGASIPPSPFQKH